ncbi:MAG: PDZ domain-containing protein [Acidobacteria bacterium ACB1]|nr:hypothetical protein [Pyrinomonadaceae bacterium]MCE7962639.1 PDZ domain-containing protein [Acidobacteria bacterium ACB1]
MVEKADNTELEATDAKLVNLLGAMPKVSAPNDFEFRVSARIASARTSAKPRGLFGALRIAVPAAALLAVTGTVLLLNPYWTETSPVSTPVDVATAERSAEDSASVPRHPIDIPSTTFASNGPSIESPKRVPLDDQLIASRPGGPSNDETGGTSFVESGTQGVKLYPRGINPNVDSAPVSPNVPNAGISVRDVLSQLGVSLTPVGNGLRVDSVVANSIADRSGIKVGDVIEGLNGKSISADSMLNGSLTARSLVIRREGKTLTLPLGR